MATKKDYKTAVLNYLKKNPGLDISRNTIIQKTNISKSRLTEILKSIRDDGYNIITPPRSGLVRFEPEDNFNVLPPIKDMDVRRWLILLLLSKYKRMSFVELLMKLMYLKDESYDQMKLLIDMDSETNIYDDSSLIKSIRKHATYNNKTINVAKDIISVTALRKDIEELRKQKLVTMIKNRTTEYRLTGSAPYIIPVSGDSLYEFCQKHAETVTETSEITPLKDAYERIKKLIGFEESDVHNNRIGRITDLTSEQIDNFNRFIVLPFSTNLLEFKSVFKGEDKIDIFAVGLLFYSVETNNFYILGKNYTEDRIECRRMDWVKDIKVLDDTHNEYHQKKYYSIYEEIFSAQYEDKSYKVKVLFSDFGNVPKRFADLNKARSKSSIRRISNKPDDCEFEFVYEDTIRGLYDFSRYLRSFGKSVIALEPSQLVEKMEFTYNRVLEKYGEAKK